MDFGGGSCRLIRYDTRGESGKTLVDSTVPDASRDRTVIPTVRGSARERAGDAADLSAILASIEVPPDA